MIVALAGGVGGAKLAAGLAAILPPGNLTVVVNTGDDFVHLGLAISPDIDTVTYTLAGLNDRTQGWGLADESWHFMSALERLGGAQWFRLGDNDLATHVERTRRLRRETLSAITADFAKRLGIRQHIIPMSDDRVSTMVDTDEGELAFQDYFVRRRCEPRFRGIRFDGLGDALPSTGLIAALEDPALEAIVICPSNPLLSIEPILALAGVDKALRHRSVPLIAVSPFIGGEAVKGPAAKIMRELGLVPTPAAVAARYDGLLDGLVIDHADAAASAPEGLRLLVTDSLMRDAPDQARLAQEVIQFARRCG
ncbi:2-phospho-L-lactate transferase [Sphingopyxis panaciterrulae]|uniref:LPPG:FO 2-phospho-L-lactate transferase n=2 Tax=Sphingopyxis TaxID=165697 RepID=A0A7W9B8R9_9SPHN|nr:2-phospho-L-lactate transferase [uncultured Sphingopyxis sp.]MBB5708156.1 LPPG:FO 2-phospho-L-lactate transferase [Sphingopyxis panaciterrulae]SBV32553.1 2-phospho-L-lactate transferase [uncultured Sphingopyxis sp.]